MRQFGHTVVVWRSQEVRDLRHACVTIGHETYAGEE